jgi:hypothetical protein
MKGQVTNDRINGYPDYLRVQEEEEHGSQCGSAANEKLKAAAFSGGYDQAGPAAFPG